MKPVERTGTVNKDGEKYIEKLASEVARLKARLREAEERERDLEETRRAMLCLVEDVNETTAGIEKAKREWEATFDSIADPIFIHDRSLRIVRCNRAYRDALGLPFKEIVGRPYYELLPRMDDRFSRCERDGSEDYDRFVHHGDRVFKLRVYNIKDRGAGEGAGALCLHVMEDVTEVRGAAERIAQEMALTRNLLKIAESTARTTDIARLLRQVADCVVEIMGCTAALVYLKDGGEDKLTPSDAAGLAPEATVLFRTTPLDPLDPMVARAVKEARPVVEEVAGGEGRDPAPDCCCFSGFVDGLTTAALVPLSGREGHLGLIVCLYGGGAGRRPVFREREMELLRGLGHQVSIALNEARLYKDTLDKTMELSRKVEIIQTMHDMDRSIVSTLAPGEILETAALMVSRIVPCERAIIVLADPEEKLFRYAAGFGVGFVEKGETVPFDDTDTTEVIRTARPQYIASLEEAGELLPLERKLLAEGFLSHLRVPLIVKGRPIGALIVGAKRAAAYSPDDLSTLKKLAGQISVAYENSRLFSDREELFIGIVRTLSEAIDAKSHWTAGHSERVTEIALEIGRSMGLDDEDLATLELAGLLHDIGKLGTDEAILDKPGGLTEEELAAIRLHTVKGAEILSHIKQMKGVVPLIRHHHEFFDGGGYPDGIRGEEIPLMARIITVADTVDAMSADRPYRKGMPMNVIIEELKRCSGRQFDPAVVDAFLSGSVDRVA